MIPVAIIMAFTLYFGTAAGHKSRIEHVPVAAAKAQGSSLHSAVTAAVPASRDKAEIATIMGTLLPDFPETTTVAPRELPDHDPSVKPREFIGRQAPRAGVPFYSSADIPTQSAREYSAPAAIARGGGGSVAPQAEFAGPRDHADGKINLNSASLSDLMNIPGIGRTRAETLLAARPLPGFHDWMEIDRLPGFGASTIQMMKMYLNLK
ncbi:MAG: helix-hairpin-helix domain-containing protein [Candidatus Hydrogenedentota bacterium]|mgnify:FL=1